MTEPRTELRALETLLGYATLTQPTYHWYRLYPVGRISAA